MVNFISKGNLFLIRCSGMMGMVWVFDFIIRNKMNKMVLFIKEVMIYGFFYGSLFFLRFRLISWIEMVKISSSVFEKFILV